ncbi:hypothetical protein F0562_010152 [Nyssa sinensis]|uniref:gibberellin 2beta-dioxygenase n=1 Tax=Nyssa sinensis TaxID=561372 RepID=A0A5J5A097_9ASTE|nr:hypothetical protein F0562_010152 [Nyssa sinensis]
MESDPPFQESYKTLLRDFMEEKHTERMHEMFFGADKNELPLIDLSRLCLGEYEQEECKREIIDAAKRWGFFQVVNHGISRGIFARMKCEQAKLFQQPFDEKANGKVLNLPTDCYRWGTPTATSLTQLAWSEAFHIPLTHVSRLKEFNSTLSSTIEEFAEVVSELAQRIAEILADNLGCKSTLFSKNVLTGSCYLRMNRYPPCPISSKVFGLVPHTDSDFLTILYQDQVGGLQLVKDGKWIRVKPNPEALIINIGDLFQAWSNGTYKSIEHRVVTNQEFERFSIAYFFCPSNDTVIQSGLQPSIYRKFSFKEYRKQVEEDVKSTVRRKSPDMADSDGGGGGCCRCCFSFILTSGLTALFMWLSLRASNPVCSIQDFYVPALDKTGNFTTNTSIYVDLKLDNENKDKGVYYDVLNLTLYYSRNQSQPIAIGNKSFDSFYQGHKKNTRRKTLVDTYGVPWDAASTAVSNGSAVFRVDLATAVRFKIIAWKTKKHKLVVRAEVPIDGNGKKDKKKGIRLKSSAPELGCYRAPAGLLIVISIFILGFI